MEHGKANIDRMINDEFGLMVKKLNPVQLHHLSTDLSVQMYAAYQQKNLQAIDELWALYCESNSPRLGLLFFMVMLKEKAKVNTVTSSILHEVRLGQVMFSEYRNKNVFDFDTLHFDNLIGNSLFSHGSNKEDFAVLKLKFENESNSNSNSNGNGISNSNSNDNNNNKNNTNSDSNINRWPNEISSFLNGLQCDLFTSTSHFRNSSFTSDLKFRFFSK
eukprot:Pgem_evm1s6469